MRRGEKEQLRARRTPEYARQELDQMAADLQADLDELWDPPYELWDPLEQILALSKKKTRLSSDQ